MNIDYPYSLILYHQHEYHNFRPQLCDHICYVAQ